MSVSELRAELFKLQKEFVGGRISTLKKHEVAQRIAVMKAAMGMKAGTPLGEPAPPGPLPPRDIPTASVCLDDSTTVIKPLPPADRKTEAASVKVPKKVVIKKAAMVPPKVELDAEEEHIIHVAETLLTKPDRPAGTADREIAPRPKKVVSKATAAPNTKKPKKDPEPEASEPKAPAVPAVIRLPGGVRPV